MSSANLGTTHRQIACDGINVWIFRLVFSGMLLLPFSTGPGEDSIVISYGLPFLAIAAFIIILKLIYQNPSFNSHLRWVLWNAGLYVSFLLVFSFFSPAVIPSLGRAIPHAIGFILFVFIISFSNSNTQLLLKMRNNFIVIFISSGAVLAGYFIVNYLAAIKNKSFVEVVLERYVGGLMSLPWGASNVIAAILLMPLIVVLVAFYISDKFNKTKYFFFGIMLMAILGTLSRTVTTIVVCLLVSVSILNKNYKLLLYCSFLIVCILGALYVYDNEILETMFSTRIKDVETISSVGGRAEIWEEIIQYIISHPLSPIGYYGSQFVFGYSGHNTILTTMVELGYFGIVATISLFGSLLACVASGINNSCKKSSRNISIIFFVGLIAMIVNLQNEDPNYTQQYIIYFWFFCGVLGLSTVSARMHEK